MGFFGVTEASRKQMLFARVLEYLKSQNWKYNVVEDGRIVEFNMGLKCKLRSCRNIIAVSEHEIQAFGIPPLKADEDNFGEVVEFITRANYGTKIGKFEFDYRDGEVRYQSCLPCREGIPSLKDIELVVDCPMLMLQRYGDGLAKNIMGFGNPAKDIQEIEGN